MSLDFVAISSADASFWFRGFITGELVGACLALCLVCYQLSEPKEEVGRTREEATWIAPFWRSRRGGGH